MEYAFVAMVGWCGTPWPGWWRGPRKPQPDPWWWFGHILGAIGGVAATIVFKDVIGQAGFVATTLTAFFGGAFLASIGGALIGASRSGAAV